MRRATSVPCKIKLRGALLGAHKSDDYLTDITATKNMVTDTASTSMNMVVTPSKTLYLRV